MQNPPSILVYGREPNLLQSRLWVFEVSGFQVSSVETLQQARQLSSRSPFDLLVLCHTLSPQEVRDAFAWARTVPAMRRLVLVAGTAAGSELAKEAVLSQFAGPRELVAAAHRVLASRPPAVGSDPFPEGRRTGQLTGVAAGVAPALLV